jgi:hypothetical protein
MFASWASLLALLSGKLFRMLIFSAFQRFLPQRASALRPWKRERDVRIVPRALFRGIVAAGDLANLFGVTIPITSSRFQSMTEDYLTPMAPTFEALGHPRIGLLEGVERTVRWLRQQDPFWEGALATSCYGSPVVPSECGGLPESGGSFECPLLSGTGGNRFWRSSLYLADMTGYDLFYVKVR